jgi:hypothetical protein
VLGKNPDASPWFVTEIGQLWKGLNESIPLNGKSGVTLNIVQGFYSDPRFNHAVYQELPQFDTTADFPKRLPVSLQNVFTGKTFAILAASGANQKQVLAIKSILEPVGPPVRPTSLVHCEYGFNNASLKPDGFIVPGGLFSTNAVLRNDGDLLNLLKNLEIPVVFVGTGQELAIVRGGLKGQIIPGNESVNRDLRDIGAVPSILSPSVKFIQESNSLITDNDLISVLRLLAEIASQDFRILE